MELWSAADPGEVIGLDVLEQMMRRPSWMRDALCREHPEVNFYPGPKDDRAPAVAVCSACLVRAECFEYAVDNGELHGIWAGMSARGRARQRAAEQRPAA